MSTMTEKLAAIQALPELTPEALVEAAKAKNHPLHNDFEWDDKVAAHKHRIETARKIFASVVTIDRVLQISSVAYVRDPRAKPNEQGMVATAVLRDDTQYAQEALDAEIDRIKSLMTRARSFAITVGLEAEFEEAIRTIARLHSSTRKKAA